MSDGLFGDVSVVEIGQYIAAPYAAELLAHGGADVVSIEPVDGGQTRHNSPLGAAADGGPGDQAGDGRQYVIKARGKRALPLTLGSDEGRRIVSGLVADADVLITNLRPALADRLGLGWDELSVRHPGLIYAEVRGFGDTGPLAEVACVDIVAQAASGLMRSLGRRAEGRPVPADVMIADYTAGSLLAFAIAAALRQRDRTGTGQRVSTSLLSACLTAQHRRANRVDAVDGGWHDELIARVAAGDDIEDLAAWRDDQIGTMPFFYNTYAVADGEVAVGAVAANGRRLLEVAGLDPDGLTAPARLGELTVAETTDLVAAHLAGRPAGPLVAALREAGVPAAEVCFLEEVLADDDVLAAGVLQRFDHPRLGPMTMPAPPVRFSAANYRAADTTPAFGEHTDELLAGLGYDRDTIDRLVADGIIGRVEHRADGGTA